MSSDPSSSISCREPIPIADAPASARTTWTTRFNWAEACPVEAQSMRKTSRPSRRSQASRFRSRAALPANRWTNPSDSTAILSFGNAKSSVYGPAGYRWRQSRSPAPFIEGGLDAGLRKELCAVDLPRAACATLRLADVARDESPVGIANLPEVDQRASWIDVGDQLHEREVQIGSSDAHRIGSRMAPKATRASNPIVRRRQPDEARGRSPVG